MHYEIWDVVSYGHGEPLTPFTLIERSEDFSEIYSKRLGSFISEQGTTRKEKCLRQR